MFSTTWGICFSLKANLNGLKTSNSGTVVAQRERLLLGNPNSLPIILLASYARLGIIWK
jgi:hypothetical protein